RLHRCPSTSRNRPRHPWQLSTRRPTVHPNGTHHENQRTTHHHRRRCRSSTINPGHRHLKPPSGAAKSRQMKLRVTAYPRQVRRCVKGYTLFDSTQLLSWWKFFRGEHRSTPLLVKPRRTIQSLLYSSAHADE